MTPGPELPKVSFVIPMLNEAEAIERCINSIQCQNYPKDNLEIVVVDGISQDGSREKVNHLIETHGNIKLLDNPQKRTPHALNIGIRNSSGDVVIILGAHTRINRDFVALNIKYMRKQGVNCVGGTQINVGETFMQKAIAAAMSSPLGIPSAPYRYRKTKHYVDTVVYAAYKKHLFSEIGFFEEEMYISEDAELNWRIRKAGHKIFYTPEIISYYYPRKTLKALIKQFTNYGVLRVNVIKKHADALKIIHVLPPLFIVSFFVLLLATILNKQFLFLLMALCVVYALYLAIAAAQTVLASKRPHFVLVLPLIFLSMQMSWGLGFLVGLFKTNK
jgi:cellulose synthase/poly-beta-1,6-N-acetylglucosamine synthase-like glycosyltransferase